MVGETEPLAKVVPSHEDELTPEFNLAKDDSGVGDEMEGLCCCARGAIDRSMCRDSTGRRGH
jgi:hypothetical protein